MPSSPELRRARESDIDAVVEIALAAWWPVTRSSDWERKFGLDRGQSWTVWKSLQLRQFWRKVPVDAYVLEFGTQMAGFVTWQLETERRIGRIADNAIHPEFMGRGLSTLLYNAVLDVFRQAGMKYATVTTRLDADHLAARRSYEKIGFEPVYESVMYGLKL